MIVHVKRAIRFFLGGIFLVLGIAGCLLPILQGWFFLGLAVLILSRDIRVLANLESRLSSRFPKVGRFFEQLKKAVPLWD